MLDSIASDTISGSFLVCVVFFRDAICSDYNLFQGFWIGVSGAAQSRLETQNILQIFHRTDFMGRHLVDIECHIYQVLTLPSPMQVWTVSLPMTILNSPAVSGAGQGTCNHPAYGGRDIAGVVIFWLGWSLESTADLEKVGRVHHDCL